MRLRNPGTDSPHRDVTTQKHPRHDRGMLRVAPHTHLLHEYAIPRRDRAATEGDYPEAILMSP
jgi:hypothetical protein